MEHETAIRDGVVVQAVPGKLTVRLRTEKEDCGGCGTCALKTLCSGQASEPIDVTVETDRVKQPGDAVQVWYRPVNPAVAAVALFLPTLIGLCGGGFAAWTVWNGNDGALIAGCLGGALVGVGVTYVVGRIFRATAPKIRLVE